MHRCAVHKLTNWHIRLLSNTKCAVTISPTSTRIGHGCISVKLDNRGYRSFTTYNGTIARKIFFLWQNIISELLHGRIYQSFLLQTIIPLVFGRATSS